MITRQVAVFGASGHTGRFVIAEPAPRAHAGGDRRDAARLAASGFEDRDVAMRTAFTEDPIR
jgi:hypothetical protein